MVSKELTFKHRFGAKTEGKTTDALFPAIGSVVVYSATVQSSKL